MPITNALSAMQESMIPEIVGIWFPKNVDHIGNHIEAYGVIIPQDRPTCLSALHSYPQRANRAKDSRARFGTVKNGYRAKRRDYPV